MKAFFLVSICAALAACGGSGTVAPTTTFAPTGGTRGIPFLPVTYDAMLDEYTLQSGVDTFVLSGSSTFDIGTFDAAVDTVGGNGVFISQTDDSIAQLTSVSGVGPGTRFTRIVPTVAPGSGTSTLTGDYVALLTNNASGNVELIMSGDASMTFDFGASTTGGIITNRVVRDATNNTVFVGVAVGDITLTETTLTNDSGIYGGTTSGGSIDLSTFMGSPTTTVGTYSVFIAGDSADEAVGGLGLLHTPVGAGDLLRETGVLALGH